MPPVEEKDCLQTAVLWEVARDGNGVVKDDYGRAKVSSPVEIEVLWNHSKRVTQDRQGNTIALAAELVVKRDIAIGSIMWLGELADFQGTGTGSMYDDTELMRVADYSEATDLRNRVTEREVSLVRHRDGLPEIV